MQVSSDTDCELLQSEGIIREVYVGPPQPGRGERFYLVSISTEPK